MILRRESGCSARKYVVNKSWAGLYRYHFADSSTALFCCQRYPKTAHNATSNPAVGYRNFWQSAFTSQLETCAGRQNMFPHPPLNCEKFPSPTTLTLVQLFLFPHSSRTIISLSHTTPASNSLTRNSYFVFAFKQNKQQNNVGILVCICRSVGLKAKGTADCPLKLVSTVSQGSDSP